MKNCIAIILLTSFITGCNNTARQLREKTAGADSIAINYFKGDGTMDTVVAVKIVKDKKSMEQLTGLITGSSSTIKNNCGYDGSIHFFINDIVVQDVFFSSNKKDCSQFVFVLNGKKVATKFTEEAIELLSAIKNN